MHCFSRGPNKHNGEKLSDVDSALHYKDSREKRIFCFNRYALSSKLPDIAKEISNRPCYHTGKGNFFCVELLNEIEEPQDYEIYFNVTRTNKKGLLRLFVESAYVRDAQHRSSQPKKKKIGFFVIAYKTQVNMPIKTPK